MRISTKILSVVLVLCMLFTTFGYAATYTDVSSDSADFSAISLLSSLGIVQGYPDGSFGATKDVTRAEFTVMLMRTLNLSNLGSTDLSGLPFSDVEPVKDWAVSDIRTAYDLGIVNGYEDATFKPNNNVTHEEALKMIVCAMGYEPMAVDVAGGMEYVWPLGYTTVAGQLSLTSGVSAIFTDPAKRIDIVKYIFNALEVDLMKTTEYPNGMVKNEIITGSNILKDKLRIITKQGELLADTDSTVFEDGVIARQDELIILPEDASDYVVYKNPGIVTKGLVGRNITYYYREDASNIKTLVHIDDATKSTSVLVIDPENIASVSGRWSDGVAISYWENANDRSPASVVINKNPVVSINGRIIDIDSYDPGDVFMLDSGSIELVDTNSSGSYNKVNIESYVTYVVNTKTSSPTKMITDMYRKSDKTYELNDEDPKVTINMTRSTNGTTVNFSSLKKYDVLSIKQVASSGNKIVIDVIVSSEKVNGAVKSVDYGADEITVDDKTYKFSNYIKNFAPELVSGLKVNDTCNFYLDKDGKIATYEKVESDNQFYAFICGVAPDEDTTEFKIIDSTGKKDITLNSAKRVKIDNDSISDPEAIAQRLYDIIDDAGGNVDGNTTNGSQLVKITKNGSGDISAIDTIADYEDESDLKLSKKIDSYDTYEYKSSTKSFSNGSDSFLIDSNTIIFTVPTDRTKYTEYAKRSLTYFKDGDKFSNIEVYDLGEGKTAKAKCIVLYGKASAEKLTARSPLLIVDSTTKVSGSDDDVYEVEGYLFGEDLDNGIEMVTTKASATAFKSAVPGDVYRISYAGVNYSGNSKLLISADDSTMSKAFYDDFDSDGDIEIVHGLLISADEETLMIAETNDIDDLIADYESSEDKTDITYTSDIYTFNVKSDTVFFTNEKGRNDKNIIYPSEENILATFETFEDSCETIVEDEDGELDTSNVVASEILIYVIKDKPVFIFRVTR